MNMDCLKECDYVENCDESKWEYLMKLAEDYKEINNGQS